MMPVVQDFFDNLGVVPTWIPMRNLYLNGPAGITQSLNSNLKEIICRIGKIHGQGSGSDQAKGVRYICRETGASKTAVKVLLKSIRNLLCLGEESNEIYIWKIHKQHFTSIFKKIIAIIDADEEFKTILLQSAADKKYSNFLFLDPINSLYHFTIPGMDPRTGEIAATLLQAISNADKAIKP